jgi:putative ABC transport system permease protein
MLNHYIVQALRSFWRFRVTAAVNLLGLVLAVVCFIATYLYLDSLVRSDQHFPKSGRTYVITQELWNSPTSRMIPALPTSGPPVAAALRADFAGLEAVGRAVQLGPQAAATDDRKIDVFTAAIDPEFLKIFDLDFKAGDPAVAASSAHSAIITERAAERLFGTTQVLGRHILLQTRVDVTITGVIAGIPQPSHMGEDGASLRFDVLVPMLLLKDMRAMGGIGVPVDGDNPIWGNDIFFTYVLFPADGSFTPQELLAQLGSFAERRANRPEIPIKSVFGAVPVSGIRVAYWDALVGDNSVSIATMIFVLDALILAIACVNYANLAVAIATTRTKEIGVRKVLGATSRHLIRQYLVEAALLGLTAIVIVVLLTLLVIEPINRALSTNFTLASLLMPGLWLMVAGLLAAISVMGGLYPAIALSKVRPVDALRSGAVRAGPSFVPTILVGVQFAAASFLLVVALVMSHQNATLEKGALQTGRDPVVVLGTNVNELNISLDSLREELLRDPRIKAVSSAGQPPWQNGGAHVTLGNSPDANARRADTIINQVGQDFFNTIDLKVLAGRALDRDRGDEWPVTPPTTPTESTIAIDRALAAALGWRDANEAVNKLVYVMNWGPSPIPFRVVGVVEDGYPRLVGPNTASNMYALQPGIAGIPLMRISREDVPGTVKYINRVWDTFAPKASSRLEFMDDLFARAYEQFTSILMVLNALAVFAFFIAVMGLCGLAIHVTSRRQREIGIRKTLGATVRGVLTMLLIDFAKPVLVANVIAWPFAWFVGQKYMEQFTQRDGLTIWPFLLSLVITVGVAWAAVAFQALRAATVKPANVLYAQ